MFRIGVILIIWEILIQTMTLQRPLARCPAYCKRLALCYNFPVPILCRPASGQVSLALNLEESRLQ